MGVIEFNMSLGIRHPAVDPETITDALGLQPEHVWRSGDSRHSQTGSALSGEYRESYWICELANSRNPTSERVELQRELTQVLNTLRRCSQFMQDLHQGGGTAELFIGIFSRDDLRLTLRPEEAALLGRLGISVAIEARPLRASAGSPTAT